MKIIVTKEDIERGRHWSESLCPVALAVQHATGKNALVSYILGVEGYVSEVAPQSVREFIERFDANRPVEPFEFDLVLMKRDE
jgi:hypothetical protein